jgi:threonine aldolase
VAGHALSNERSLQVNFRSDNEAPAAPEIMAALARANTGSAHAYGADAITARLEAHFAALFETDLAVYPVSTGTAANALCLAELAPPYGAVWCHEAAHINVDECGAPEFYTGGAKLMAMAGAHGRIDPALLAAALEATGAHGEHESVPTVLSLTQATEAGTVYRPAEVAALSAIARRHGLAVHMDGARFANAVVRLGCRPADITWRAGVDMLSFGATKNGALAAEAVVDFRPPDARPGHESLRRRRMRGGHLLSKMRYVSAQLEAYLADDLWLELARRANDAAARLAAGLEAVPGVALAHPVEANELFVHLPLGVAEALAGDGIEFHRWPGADGVIRLVVPYCVEEGALAHLIERASAHAGTPRR